MFEFWVHSSEKRRFGRRGEVVFFESQKRTRETKRRKQRTSQDFFFCELFAKKKVSMQKTYKKNIHAAFFEKAPIFWKTPFFSLYDFRIHLKRRVIFWRRV